MFGTEPPSRNEGPFIRICGDMMLSTEEVQLTSRTIAASQAAGRVRENEMRMGGVEW
jgi:hypothetical protein